MPEWIITPFDLARDLDEVAALDALCFTNPTTREMFRREVETSDVAHVHVMRLVLQPRLTLVPSPDHVIVSSVPMAGLTARTETSGDPAPGDLAPGDPAPPDPAATDPAATDPAGSDPPTAAIGPVLAYCAVWLIFDELHINTLAVHPEWRRRGVASRLLAHVLVDAARRGATRATLEVRRSNEAALRLYTRFGFTVGGIRPAYYRQPVEDALILWRTGLQEPPAPADNPAAPPPNGLA